MLLLAPLGLTACGADPVTGPILAGAAAVNLAETTVEVVGVTAVAIGNALTPAPTPPPTLSAQANTLTLEEARTLMTKISRGEKQLANLTPAERQQVQLILAAAKSKRDR
jgi:hypothetical protein